MIYDLAGRLTEKQYHTGATPASDPAQTVVITQGPTLESTDTFAYDAASRITETVKGRHGITTEHTYAADSQPLTETVTADTRTYTMSRSYDDANRVTSQTYPDGKATTWSYDSRNIVTNVAYEGEAVVSQIHDAAYRLTNQTLGNGLTRTINYGRQDNLRTTDGTWDGVTSLDDLSLSYTYAADKQITAESIVGDVVQNTSFTAQYDAGNRISNWQRVGGFQPPSQTWSYDDAGNWNSTTKDGNLESRNHSVSDQITSIAGNAAAHDLKGNLTEYEINSKVYEVNYDVDNRIIKVDVNNHDVEYRYDAFGRLVIRKEGSTETALLWWGNSECAEYEHSAGQTVIQNDIMSHPTRLNSVIARAVDGSKFDLEWYHKNYLDHVYAVSDDSGDLNEHYRYTAFGEATIYNGSGTIQTNTQINNSILWNTRRLDIVSNYYLYKYRHYDPVLGRWPSRDPIEEKGGINLYAFVGNDPVRRWDLLGLATIYTDEITGGIEVPCCKGQEGVLWITDDAKRRCCENEIVTIEIRIVKPPRRRVAQQMIENRDFSQAGITDGTGHAYIYFPSENQGIGFYPNGSFLGGRPGMFMPERGNYQYSRSFIVCPKTYEKIKAEIERLDDLNPVYSILDATINDNCIHCTTFVTEVFTNSGIEGLPVVAEPFDFGLNNNHGFEPNGNTEFNDLDDDFGDGGVLDWTPRP